MLLILHVLFVIYYLPNIERSRSRCARKNIYYFVMYDNIGSYISLLLDQVCNYVLI